MYKHKNSFRPISILIMSLAAIFKLCWLRHTTGAAPQTYKFIGLWAALAFAERGSRKSCIGLWTKITTAPSRETSYRNGCRHIF